MSDPGTRFRHHHMSLSIAVDVYRRLLEAWNRRDAAGFAAFFTPAGLAIGFDGSQMDGRPEIEQQLAAVFAHHQTAAYVARVRGVRVISPGGATAINPAVNALQSVLVVGDGEAAQIALLQTTPAAFHGRPHLAEQLTAEVSEVLRRGAVVAAG
jgi:uncharacterized protein (TIGR02246 family)